MNTRLKGFSYIGTEILNLRIIGVNFCALNVVKRCGSAEVKSICCGNASAAFNHAGLRVFVIIYHKLFVSGRREHNYKILCINNPVKFYHDPVDKHPGKIVLGWGRGL